MRAPAPSTAAAGYRRHADYEQIQIYNVTNGERFTTYAMRAEAGSGIISINGAAAHRAKPGDRIIICAYCQMNAAEAINHKPRLIYLNEHNKDRTDR